MHGSTGSSVGRTYSTVSWFGAIGVGTSLYMAGQYFEYWLRNNDPAEHPLVEEFIHYPMKMVTQTPAVMATKPVLSVVLSGLLLAILCFRLWVAALWQYCRLAGAAAAAPTTD